MLLEQIFLTEKLGTLKSLNVGQMINILKQSKAGDGRRGEYATPVGKKFGGDWTSHPAIGSKSEIVDVGVIKNGIGGLRKAYKAHESAEAFALYVDGKAVAFGKFTADTLGGSSRTGILAYDLSPFKEKIEKDRIKARELSSHRVETNKRWNYKTDKYEDEINVYHGKIMSTAGLKEFLQELQELADGKAITGKLVLADVKAQEKRRERYSISMSQGEALTGLEALRKRLAKYKISKKPTASSIEDFLKTAFSGAGKVVQFAGRGYSTTPQNSYASDSMKPLDILSGKSFAVRYSSVDPGSYESIEVKYAFNKADGTLKPFKVTWKEDHKTRTVALEPDMFLKRELGIKSLDKDTIIKAILNKIKSNQDYEARGMIDAARKAGHDYPEFKAIEKSLNAKNKKGEDDEE